MAQPAPGGLVAAEILFARSTPHAPTPPDCPAVAPPSAEATELAALTGDLARLDRLRHALEGPRSEWPEDAPEAIGQAALEPVVAAAAAASGHDLELLGADCVEYPCIAVYQLRHDDREPNVTYGTYGDALSAQLEAHLTVEGLHLTQTSWRGGPNGEHRVAIGVFAGPRSGDVAFRYQQRIADLMAE